MGGARVRQTSFLTDVLHYWSKTKECAAVTPVMKAEGADFDAALSSNKVGLRPQVSYLVQDKQGKVVVAKTVTPKNVAKDICKGVSDK